MNSTKKVFHEWPQWSEGRRKWETRSSPEPYIWKQSWCWILQGARWGKCCHSCFPPEDGSWSHSLALGTKKTLQWCRKKWQLFLEGWVVHDGGAQWGDPPASLAFNPCSWALGRNLFSQQARSETLHPPHQSACRHKTSSLVCLLASSLSKMHAWLNPASLANLGFESHEHLVSISILYLIQKRKNKSTRRVDLPVLLKVISPTLPAHFSGGHAAVRVTGWTSANRGCFCSWLIMHVTFILDLWLRKKESTRTRQTKPGRFKAVFQMDSDR